MPKPNKMIEPNNSYIREHLWVRISLQTYKRLRDQIELRFQVKKQVKDQVGGQIFNQIWTQIWRQANQDVR